MEIEVLRGGSGRWEGRNRLPDGEYGPLWFWGHVPRQVTGQEFERVVERQIRRQLPEAGRRKFDQRELPEGWPNLGGGSLYRIHLNQQAKTFLGLAFSASMLPSGKVEMVKEDLAIEEVKRAISAGVEVCLNPSHQSTIDALRVKYRIEVEIPETPPQISLNPGDSIIILQVSGLPRLTDRHEYTPEEITSAIFKFMEITVK